MLFNKDIIIRAVLGLIVFVMFIKIVGPVILELLKNKMPGSYNPDNDIDVMIRRQKDRLRAQYGQSSATSPEQTASLAIENLYKESRWGGGHFSRNMQTEISKNYSYTLAESKVNAFVLLSEKKQYLRFLSADNQKSPDAIRNYLTTLMLFIILIDEIRNKEFSLLEKVAKKCHISTMELGLAIQLKILMSIKSEKNLKDERIYVENIVLNQYPEDTIKWAVDYILGKEANLWARSHSHFFEELSLHLSYADILIPSPKLNNKKDMDTAYTILGVDPLMEMDEIKKVYKKIAMARHPDKIGQMKLPKILESKALAKFNHIQEAYELINHYRKK